MNFYIDSSALVKLYIEEVGSERMRGIAFSDKNNIFISKINDGMIFISADGALNDAAEIEGLAVEALGTK